MTFMQTNEPTINTHGDKLNGTPQRVRFEFASYNAESVSIAGTFNDWRPAATPMILLGDGRWAKDLILPPGRYEYCLVVDGQWVADPRASETGSTPFGGQASVRKIRSGS
jgi:1,4-alpha-glucan branching enzyme